MMRKKWIISLSVLLGLMIIYYVYYLAVQKNVGQDLLKHKTNVVMANINGTSTSQTASLNVTFYTPDSQGQTLQKTESILQLPAGYADYDVVKAITTAYIAQDNAWMDPTTQVINVFIQNGTAYLNLSSGFTSKMDTAAHTALIISGLVNTITQNDTNITQVAFLVNGQASSVINQNMNNQQFFQYSA